MLENSLFHIKVYKKVNIPAIIIFIYWPEMLVWCVLNLVNKPV